MNHYPDIMSTAVVLDREEYVEQAYLFRIFRERLADNLPAQDILDIANQEILTTTRLPYAIQFLAAELKHSGLLASGFSRLPHYFTAFQSFVIRMAESESHKLPMATALLVLEREAAYKAETPTRPGLYVYQFETITRNRLGFMEGLEAMAADPHYDTDWAEYIRLVRRQIGVIDFADLVYLSSDLCVKDNLRSNPEYAPARPPLFGEKEGKIAKASHGRDPLYLFAALQRQLGYPEVPRYKQRDDLTAKFDQIQNKLRELEMRLRLAESELRGSIDLSQFGKPDLLKDDEEEPPKPKS